MSNVNSDSPPSLREMQTSLDDCPDELLLSIFSDLDPTDLVSLGNLSRRLRLIALDDWLWRPICARIINICRPADEEGLPVDLAAWATNCYLLWNRLLRRWEPYLGFWVDGIKSSNVKDVLRISASNRTKSIQVSSLTLRNTYEFDDQISQTQEWGGAIVVTEEDGGPGVLIGAETEFSNNGVLFVDRFKPRFTQTEMKKFTYPVDESQKTTEPPFEEQPFESQPQWLVIRTEYMPQPIVTRLMRTQNQSRSNIYFPTPPLIPAFPNLSFDKKGSLIQPTLTVPWSDYSSMLQVRSPSSKEWPQCPPDLNIIEPGLYAATYSTLGIEILSVTVRELTESDFQRSGDDDHFVLENEGHFGHDDPAPHRGPFAHGETPNPFVSPGQVSVGHRILEIVKVQGDSHVPKGQRSIIGFFDVPSVSADLRQAMEDSRAVEKGQERDLWSFMPEQSKRTDDMPPWPSQRFLPPHEAIMNPQARRRAMNEEQCLAPGEGFTVHGVGRIAGHHFRYPSWTNAVVHFQSRTEIQIWWLGIVMTFSRISNL